MLHVITAEEKSAELELMLASGSCLESSEISIIQLVTESPTISSSNVSTVLFFSLKLKIHGMLTNVQNARKTHSQNMLIFLALKRVTVQEKCRR